MPVRIFTAAILILAVCGAGACHRAEKAAAQATEATPPPAEEAVALPAETTPPKVSP